MKTALIIGINGNFGRHMTKALQTKGWSIRALLRDASKAPRGLTNQQLYVGSSQDKDAVEKASKGVDLIVYAANPPYHRWPELALTMLEPTAQVAQEKQLRILFPGNVYNFQPQAGKISEQTEMNPPTDKGIIRVQMEERLQQASEHGAKVTIIRAGDFLGPDMALSWMNFIAKPKSKTKTKDMVFSMPHQTDHLHFWSYLPDLCANTAQLLDRSSDNFEIYHDPGLPLTTADWQQAFSELNKPLRIKPFPWWFFNVVAPFNPMLKDVLKMRYLWNEHVVLDGQTLSKKLGDERVKTPLSKIVQSIFYATTECESRTGDSQLENHRRESDKSKQLKKLKHV